jgi:hypothetical protein
MRLEQVRSFAVGCLELGSLFAFIGALMLWADALTLV